MLRRAAAMQLLPVAVVLLAAVASAQQLRLQVQDLVLPEPHDAHGAAPRFVHRAFAGSGQDGPRPFHDVAAARHLAPWLQPGLGASRASERAGTFSEETLTASLAAMSDLDRRSITFTRLGDTVLLRTAHPEQAAAALERIRRSLPPRIHVAVTLQRAARDVTTTLLDGAHTFADGRVHVFADVVERAIVRDFEVELAQSSSTANPIVDVVTHGAAIALRVRPLPFRDAVVVEAVMRVAAPLAVEPLVLHRAMGPIDRVATRVDEGGFACVLTADEQQPATQPARRSAAGERRARLQGEWTCADGSKLRLTCVASWTGSESQEQERTLAILKPAPLLAEPVLGFRSSRLRDDAEEPPDALWADRMVQAVQAEHGGEVLQLLDADGNSPLLLLTGGDAARVERQLSSAFAAELQPARIELELLDAAAGQDFASPGPLPDGVRVLGSMSQPVLVGLPVSFGSGRERSYVRDWEVEVAQASRIPDPKIDVVEDGWFATARVVRPVRGGQPRLHLTLEVCDVAELRRTSVAINAAMTALASVSDDQRSPAMWLPQDEVWMELPVVRSMRIDTVVDLDADGSVVLRRSAGALLGNGRVLVVRARVRQP